MVIDFPVATFASAFTQEARLLTLHFAPGSGIVEGAILPHRLSGAEHLSQCYRYDLDCLASDVFIDLKSFLGLPVAIRILQAGGDVRTLSGVVTTAEQRGSDGGFARFGLIIEPAFATLIHRINSRAFQQKSVPDIVKTILDEHIAANPVFAQSFRLEHHLNKTYPSRSYCTQYRESDLAFIERLLAEEGVSYRFIFDCQSDTPVHAMVLFDDVFSLEANAQEHIRFHRADGTEAADSISDWQASRQIRSGKSSLASYDYKTVSLYSAHRESATAQGDGGNDLSSTLEDYEPQAPYYGAGNDEMERYARLRQQAKDYCAKTYTGQGTVRSLQAGTWFRLSGHAIHDQDGPEQREFVVTSLALEANNNLPQNLRDELAGLGFMRDRATAAAPYANTFTAVRRGIPVVPLYSRTVHARPTAPGIQSAIVVGPAEEEIFTDQTGRIKIQFAWQRSQDHPEGGASWDDRSSTWVRIAYPSADAGWGAQHIPRVGSEVLVAYYDGDIDRPVCFASVHNGAHLPPAFSGAGTLPANKTLSGIKDKEYKGRLYNELLFDSTTGQMRAKLSSEHGKTQLNQGYLIHPRSDGKGDPRGDGFELRTDEAGALRAAKGLLVSAWARMQGSATQLSRDEFNGLLTDCYELFAQLGKYAAENQAMQVDAGPQDKLRQDINNWENGSNTAPAKEGGGQPVIAVTAAAGISVATPVNIVTYAGKHHDGVAQHHMQLTAGQRFNVNAGKGISLFSHNEGVKAIAHYGKMQLQAQHDDVEINASENVSITATHGRIAGTADQEVVFITAGGAYLKLSGANVEIGCPGSFTVKSASHNWSGAASIQAALPTFKGGNPDQKFVLHHSSGNERLQQLAANRAYEVTMSDGSVVKGIADAAGNTGLLQSDAMHVAAIRILDPKP